MRHTARPNPLLEALAVLGVALGLLVSFQGCGDSEGATGGRPVRFAAPAASLEGRVFDATTGAAIGGAAVRLEGSIALQGTSRLLEATTDFLGRYRFPEVPPGHYELRAVSGLHRLRRRGVDFQSGTGYTEDLGLTPVSDRGAAELTVVDAVSGALLAGVDVFEIQVRERGLTNAAGEVLFTNLPVGVSRFQLSLPGYSTRTVAVEVRAGELTTPEIRLFRIGGSLAGTITSTPPAMPLPGALVSAPGLDLETVTDALGRYLLENVPAIFVDLVITHPSHMPLFATTSVRVGEVTTFDATMVRAFGQLQGVVRGPGGLPVAGASVVIPEHLLSTTTDLGGFYLFDEVPADLTLTVGAIAPNLVTTSVSLVMPPNGFVVQDIFMAGSTGSVTGQVLATDTMAPVVGAILSIPNLFLTTFSDGTGNYTFSNIPAQVHLLQVTATGFSGVTTTISVPTAATLNQDILLPPLAAPVPPAGFGGVVRSSATTAVVPFAVVSVPAESRTTVANASGAYSLTGLTTTGPVSVVVNAAGFSDLVTSVTLVPGSFVLQDLVVTPF